MPRCAPWRSKLRAVQHLLQRAGKTLGDLASAVEGVATDLEDAFAELGSEWRGMNRDRFLQMMIADGSDSCAGVHAELHKRKAKGRGNFVEN